MASKKTKKLSAQPKSTTVGSNEMIVKVSENGNVTLINLEDLRAAIMGGRSLNSMMDGAFIMYHTKNNNSVRMVKPHKWATLQQSGDIADGVVIVEGGKVLVIAPTEAPGGGLKWSSEPVDCGGTSTDDRLTAINDWNGKANTEAIISASSASAVTDAATYGAGFCHNYSRVNANGVGLTAGKWWMPSIGEMLMIFANLTKINYCLSRITGATQLVEDLYSTSTENGTTHFWGLSLSVGGMNNSLSKKDSVGRVRPVSAFIL